MNHLRHAPQHRSPWILDSPWDVPFAGQATNLQTEPHKRIGCLHFALVLLIQPRQPPGMSARAKGLHPPPGTPGSAEGVAGDPPTKQKLPAECG
eukprot:15438529-Alexandrium_andersonii.AAC.1